MWPDRPVDLAGVSVDEPCAPADSLDGENGETPIARGLPRCSDTGGAVDLEVGLSTACCVVDQWIREAKFKKTWTAPFALS